MKRIIAAAAIAAMLPMASMAQNTQKVVGRLTLLKSFPVQNMTVTSTVTGNTAKSNADGVFSLQTVDKDVLKVECSPFKNVNYKVRLGKVDTIRIEMTFPRKATYLTEIMDKGYLAPEYEPDAFSALTFQKDFSKYNDIDQAISLELPGVQIEGSDCYKLPGNMGYMLLVVGNTVVSTIQDIPTSNIEDIMVIKGGQAAVYGVQGANGVLVIKIKNTDNELIKRD